MKSLFTMTSEAHDVLVATDPTKMVVAKASPTRVAFVDPDSGIGFSVHGHGLRIDHGSIQKGTIDELNIDLDGAHVVHAENFSIKASGFAHASLRDFFNDFNAALIAQDNRIVGSAGNDVIASGFGDDIIRGRAGDDRMSGQQGDDIMTGGDGNDEFGFIQGFGHDVITDFDPIGGVGHQDVISGMVFEEAKVTMRHGDTILDLGAGDTLRLIGIDKADIDASDFIL